MNKSDGITPDTLSVLRERIRPYLTEKRYRHTLEVEEEAARIGAIYLPGKVDKLRVAALLHDITKQLTFEKQLQCCREFDIMIDTSSPVSAGTLHAITGAAVAAEDFSDVTDEEILAGIRWHTTGHDGMTVFESIVYLADYIEPSRDFEDCIALRNYFWGGIGEEDDTAALIRHLCRTMVLSFDCTIQQLIASRERIGADTVLARNCFLGRLETLDGNG